MALARKPTQIHRESDELGKSDTAETSRSATKKTIELYSAFEDAFTGVVIFGVALEALAPIIAAPDTWIFTRCLLLGNAYVVIGLLVEFFAGSKAKKLQEGLTEDAYRELGEAKERAASAERETERLRAIAAWRALTEKQHKGLALALKASGAAESVKFCVVLGDNESFTFASRISIPFAAANWKIGFRFATYLHGTFTGICIPEPRDNWLDEMKDVNRRVREAFIAAEIPFVNGWREEHSYVDDNAHITAPFAWVYVGPKPPPPHDWSFEDAPA